MLFGVDKSQATGFSIVVFTLLTLPLLLIGMIAISQTGLILRNISWLLRNSRGKGKKSRFLKK